MGGYWQGRSGRIRIAMRNARVRNLLTVGAGVGVAAWLLYATRTPDLVRLAQPVAGTENWVNAYSDHFWTSDDTVVSLEFGYAHCPVVYDLSTGRKTNLSALYKRLTPRLLKNPQVAVPSPDGRWLSFDADNVEQAGFLFSIDGASKICWKRRRVPDAEPGPIMWLPRNRGWIETHTQYKAARPPQLLIYAYPFPALDSRTMEPTCPPVVLPEPGPNLIAHYETASERGVWFTLHQKFPSSSDIVEAGVVDLQSRKATIVRLPWLQNEEFREVAASPAGSKLAWLTWTKGRAAPTGRFGWLYRLFGYVRPAEMQLRVTDGHGNRAREIGRVQVKLRTWTMNGQYSHTEAEGPYQLRWTPSGRYISFVFRGKLWRLPAD
jgi:hypothetical protein